MEFAETTAFLYVIAPMGIPLSAFPMGQFIRFIAIGLLNTAFGYGIFAALVWTGIAAPVALLLATIIGIFFNFFTTGRLVFNNRNYRLVGRFIGTYGVVYVVNVVMLNYLHTIGLESIPAQGLCLILTVPLTFVLQKTIVFRT